MTGRRLLAAALALMLSACATRPPLDFACVDPHPQDPQRRLFHPLPPGGVLDDIVADPRRATAAEAALPADPCLNPQSPFAIALCAGRSTAETQLAPPQDTLLLLSGGGPWGAFGAGFLHQLHATGRYPSPRVVTGVSTGALQTLLLASHSPLLADRFERLVVAYRPEKESDIVERGEVWQAALRGSIAGTAPLRARIERELCLDGDPARGCPGIAAIRESAKENRSAFIGFVAADTGEFLVADLVRIAAQARDDQTEEGASSRRKALDCLTGAAMASSAVPVQLQQVRIGERTMLDGGVRLSVFEARAIADAYQVATGLGRPAPPIYVVRNGPTRIGSKPAPPGKGPNGRLDVLEMAAAAQTIIVNQVEVASIGLVRLDNPGVDMFLITADGAEPGCNRPDGSMFDPGFMKCLLELGRERAGTEGNPWSSVRRIGEPAAPR